MNNIESDKTKDTRKSREIIDEFKNIKGIEGVEDEEGTRSKNVEEIQNIIDSEGLVLPEIPSEAEMRKVSETLSVNKEDELWLSRATRGVLKRVGTIKKWTGSQR